ncbi:hypothetical protein Tco_0534794 [Tanacetum coccineum]
MSLRKKALQRIDLQCLDVGIWEYHQGDDCSWDLGKVKSQYENIDEFRKLCYVMAYGVEELLDWIMDSGGSYHITYKRDYLVDFEEYDGGNILLGDGREMRNRGLRFHKQKYEEWESPNILGVLVTTGLNGLVKEINVTLLAKVLASIKQGMLEPVKVKCIFLGYRKGTGSVQVLQGVEFKVEPREDHTFEVEPHVNVDHVAGSHEAVLKLAFAVAEAEKIYAHESLTFNNTVACEVIFKWKVGLKDDMDVRSDVYVLSNGCKKCSDDNDVYYWEYTPAESGYKGLLDKEKGNVLGMEIIRDQSGNTLRVSQSRFYNGKLVHTLLEEDFILSLEGSLSRDCDVEKNGKWSCIYAVGSQEYQVVCTRLDIASADVAMMLHMMALSPTEAGYMTLTEAAKEAIWLKGLTIESGFELKIVAGIATGALSKAIPGPRFQHRLNLLSIDALIKLCKRDLDLDETFAETIVSTSFLLLLQITLEMVSERNSHVTTAVLFDDEWKVSIRLVNTNEYNSEVLANIHIDIALDS